jgi:chemotaxis protein CheX
MERRYLLIVEPDSELLEITEDKLKELTGMIVVTSKDGVNAYQKARNSKLSVIFTEFEIPKIKGSEFVSAVRETNLNANTPILIYTKDIDAAKMATRGKKFIFFIQKPAEYQVIADKIESLSKIDPKRKMFKIDVDFINPFIDASVKTLNGLCGMENIEAMKAHLLQTEVLEIDISGTLAISSPYFKGMIAISFDDNVYKSIVARMIEEDVSEVTIDTQDGVAEIINIIFGQTKAVLNQKGYSLERAIPSVARGRGHKIYQDDKIPVLVVPFRSELGNFWMQICVKAI